MNFLESLLFIFLFIFYLSLLLILNFRVLCWTHMKLPLLCIKVVDYQQYHTVKPNIFIKHFSENFKHKRKRILY